MFDGASADSMHAEERDLGRDLLKFALVGVVILFLALGFLFFMMMSSTSSVSTVIQACQMAAQGDPDGGGGAYTSTEPSEEALADIPKKYLEAYRAAGEEYGLDWAVLAGIGKVESNHGRADYARNAEGCIEGPPTPYGTAKGDMQFIDSSWEIYGRDADNPDAPPGSGDPCNYDDAIYAAAVHIKEGGAPQDYRAGIYSYNNAGWYVDKVLAQADKYRAAAESQGGGGSSGDSGGTEGSGGGYERTDASRFDASRAVALVLSPLRASEAYAQSREATVGSPGGTEFSSTELETVELINEFRSQNGLEPLQVSEQVSVPAARYAHDMAKYDAYGQPEPHITGPSDYYPEGADLVTRMNNEGYYATEYGENIAAGQDSAREVFEAWKTSPPHREMMLNPGVTTVGIGLVENPDTDHEQFWVTNFGDNRDATAKSIDQLRESEPGASPSGASPSGASPSGASPSGASPSEGSGSSGDGSSSPGSSIEGQDAVFPVPGDYQDDYEDGWSASHEGTDIQAPEISGEDAQAIVGGTVRKAEGSNDNHYSEEDGYNIMVEAAYDAGPIKQGDMIYYAHLQNPPAVSEGERVEAGDVIGQVGDTGGGPEVTRGQSEPGLHVGWYDPTGQRAESASGAMNPFTMLNWLAENEGEVQGGGEGSDAGSMACPADSSSSGSGGTGGSSGEGAKSYPGAQPTDGGTGQNGQTPEGWDLVENESKTMTYYSKTRFNSYVEQAVGEWNSLGGVKITPAASEAEANLVIRDVPNSQWQYGWAWGYTKTTDYAASKGEIVIKAEQAETGSETNRKALMVHEIGHALGMAHANDRPSVMNQDLQTAVPNEYDRGIYAEVWGGTQ